MKSSAAAAAVAVYLAIGCAVVDRYALLQS